MKEIKAGKVIIGLIIGSILGIAGTFYTFNGRLVKVETQLKNIESKSLGGERKPNVIPKVPEKEITFADTFDSNMYQWEEESYGEYSKTISDGKYILALKNDGRMITGEIYFPANIYPGTNYSITLKCNYSSGSKDRYFGLLLRISDSTYYMLGTNANGYVYVWRVVGDSASEILNLPGYNNSRSDKFRLKVDIRGKKFYYYVNGKEAGDGLFENVDWKKIGVYVLGPLTIEFDEIAIMKD
ncbi:MAG: hypothetical protein PVH61_42330 [Candidatus Aminicenantes bacterium]|jgi:hypothetical protein